MNPWVCLHFRFIETWVNSAPSLAWVRAAIQQSGTGTVWLLAGEELTGQPIWVTSPATLELRGFSEWTGLKLGATLELILQWRQAPTVRLSQAFKSTVSVSSKVGETRSLSLSDRWVSRTGWHVSPQNHREPPLTPHPDPCWASTKLTPPPCPFCFKWDLPCLCGFRPEPDPAPAKCCLHYPQSLRCLFEYLGISSLGPWFNKACKHVPHFRQLLKSIPIQQCRYAHA